MSLPNPSMDAVPFTPLTAAFLDDMIENIEALAAGTGLNDGSIATAKYANSSVTPAKWTNPYKFSAYRNGAWSTPNNTVAVVLFDAELFDTNSNYNPATGRYTAPVAGDYYFKANTDFTVAVSAPWAALFKNGSSEVLRGTPSNASAYGVGVEGLLRLAANDTIETRIYTPSAQTGSTGSGFSYFHGFLQSP